MVVMPWWSFSHPALPTDLVWCRCVSRSYTEALLLCFRGGAFSAVLVISMCVLGVSILHILLHALFVGEESGSVESSEVPLLLAGYGFGASFVALFMQLGGGVYTKAADVGADLVGKVCMHAATLPPTAHRMGLPLCRASAGK